MSDQIIILIPYFGHWPEWINLFIESCRWNPDIRWRFYTDCGMPENRCDNVDYVHLDFNEYKALVREKLIIPFDPPHPYKLCDLRPCFGVIHRRDIDAFPYFGYGDIDVIYGNIRAVYTDEVLAGHDVFSTHASVLSGHFAVFRNTEMTRCMYQKIPYYDRLIQDPRCLGVDEGPFARAFRLDPIARLFFIERYSTILSPLKRWHDGTLNYPRRWYWKCGRLTNDQDGPREFLYLHFMRWKSATYISNPPLEGEAAWLQLDRVMRVEYTRASVEGFSISRNGFEPL